MKQVVVLHGWSDNSKSFKPLIAFLKKNGLRVTPLFLGDYQSLRDDVQIEDVAQRLEQVVREKMARPPGARDRLDRTFDLIVHSTGGLLARWWIARYYRDKPCPVRNLLMLAPANFGSVLAHTGRTLVGRAFKGAKSGFEVGEEMLHALELGSRFQMELAQSDLFYPEEGADNTILYGPDKTRPFVITGTHPYKQLTRKLVNENASDGTVRVAAANLNAEGVTIDFTRNLENPTRTTWRKRGGAGLTFPLAVLPDRDHGNVIDPGDEGHTRLPAYQSRLGELIIDALSTNTEQQYRAKVDAWQQITGDTRTYAGFSDAAVQHRRDTFGRNEPSAEYFHEHFQLVVSAEDQFGQPVENYFVEFFPKAGLLHRFSNFGRLSNYFYDEVLEHTHTNRRDPSRQCMFIDRYDLMGKGGFYDQIRKDDNAKLLSFTAIASDPGSNVSYFAHGSPAKRGVIDLHGVLKRDRFLKRHTTHFIRMIVPRVGDDSIFKLKRA
ncbi:MAG: hypothetical protein RJQ07_02950 [Pseudomonadales bacterium]